jgi:hypothetical protein
VNPSKCPIHLVCLSTIKDRKVVDLEALRRTLQVPQTCQGRTRVLTSAQHRLSESIQTLDHLRPRQEEVCGLLDTAPRPRWVISRVPIRILLLGHSTVAQAMVVAVEHPLAIILHRKDKEPPTYVRHKDRAQPHHTSAQVLALVVRAPRHQLRPSISDSLPRLNRSDDGPSKMALLFSLSAALPNHSKLQWVSKDLPRIDRASKVLGPAQAEVKTHSEVRIVGHHPQAEFKFRPM